MYGENSMRRGLGTPEDIANYWRGKLRDDGVTPADVCKLVDVIQMHLKSPQFRPVILSLICAEANRDALSQLQAFFINRDGYLDCMPLNNSNSQDLAAAIFA